MRAGTSRARMRVIESADPTPRQLMASLSSARYPLFGGAMGGGKTSWLCNCGVTLSCGIPGNRGYMCRHELHSFKRSTLLELQKWLDPELLAMHNRSEGLMRFKNGSEIFYGGLGDEEKAIERLKSMELGWFAIDQVEETTEKHFLLLCTRLRLNIPGIVYKGLCTANPTDNWVKKRWIDPSPSLPDHEFIPAFIKDNPYNPADYEEKQREVLPPDLVQPWIEGDWNAVSCCNALFPFARVRLAMERQIEASKEVTDIGVDVAWDGDDETVTALKQEAVSKQGKGQGARFRIVRVIKGQDTMQTADDTMELMRIHKKADVKIDVIGYGAGVYDRVKRKLKELRSKWNYTGRLLKYKASEKAKSPERYRNRRAEDMFTFARNLNIYDIPQDNKLGNEMSIRYRVLSADGLQKVESKEEFKKRMKISTDRLDAIIMADAKVKESRKGKVFRW